MSDDFGVFLHYRSDREVLEEILKGVQKLMADVVIDSTKLDAINTALQTLTTDTTTALADIAAKIAALQNATPDPATATELGNILTSVQSLDAQIKTADPGPVKAG